MVSSSSMRRRLCRRCNGVVALVAMASLPLPMCRGLAFVDDDGNGATGDDDDDVDDNGATGDDDDNDQDAATDNKVDNDDGDGAMDDDINDNCDGVTGDDDDNDATDEDVNDNGNGATDDGIDDYCNYATDGHHRLDACGGCATKGGARQRHTTTGDATTSRRTRCKWERRCQWTRGDRATIGQGCALRGGGRVERMRGGGIDLKNE